MAAERERLEAERAESQKMMAELLQLKRELSGKGGDDLSPPQEEAPPDEKTEESCQRRMIASDIYRRKAKESAKENPLCELHNRHIPQRGNRPLLVVLTNLVHEGREYHIFIGSLRVFAAFPEGV